MDKFDLVRFADNAFELDVRADSENDTVWLTQDEIAVLFERERSVITRHINAIFNDGELDKNTYVHFLHESNNQPKNRRPTKIYSLDVVLSVGYRVNSKRGIIFRKWANNVLKEYLLKGYVLNENRTLVTNQNYINLINRVDSIDSRLKMIENNELSYKNIRRIKMVG